MSSDKVSLESVIAELNSSEELICDENVNWCQQLNNLAFNMRQMSTFAHEFDYSADVKHNGMRSLMKIVKKYLVEVSSSLQVLKQNPRDKTNMEKLRVLRGQCCELLTMAKTMNKIRDLTSENEPHFEGLMNYALENRIEASSEQTAEQLIDYYDPNFFFPWLAQWFRDIFRLSIVFIYLSSNPLSKSLTEVFSKASVNRFYAQYASGAHLHSLRRNYNNLFDGWLTTWVRWVHKLIHFNIKSSYLTLRHRQNNWLIDERSKCIKKCSEDGTCDLRPVNCVLMKPSDFESNNLILFVHGGGFISLTTDAYKSALLPLVKETDAAVVSVEYSLSPQAKYPVALQECLDVYLNLVSPDPITGFRANKLILTGDSAGGYFVLAMAIAIAEIRQLQMSSNEPPTRLPDAINAVYPLTSCCIANLYPSRALNDFILVPSIGFEVANAYAGSVDLSQDSNSLWYKDEARVRDVSMQINSRVSDPFFHLPGYKHFDRLKDVPLSIQVGEFDPLLDDSIAFAKCWRGPVTIDVVPEATHAWFQLEFFAPKSFPGCNLVRRRIKEVFDRKLLSN